ncbi:MAG: alpha/beta hydrolase [Elusimicrobia bacterium]|nr:alpha/beta hydrolase [Elusimicrobiota bacterium]
MPTRKAIKPAVLVPVFLVSGLLAFRLCGALFPYQTFIAIRKVSMTAGGVRRIRAGSLAGYERDLCEPRKPCRCVGLIHGLSDSALTWDNVLLGKRGADKPAPGTLYVALEYPGSEGSFPPAAGFTIPAMAEAMRASLEPKCSKWTLVGNSLGGWIAAWMALQWPDGVERLILLSPAGFEDPTGLALETARTLEEPTPQAMEAFMAKSYHRPMPIPKRAWPAIIATLNSRPTKSILSAMRREDLLDRRASAIRAPTLVLWGSSDRTLPLAVGEGFARTIRGARLMPVKDCGHLPQQECPAAVTRALAER